jgi:hypothetical protein
MMCTLFRLFLFFCCVFVQSFVKFRGRVLFTVRFSRLATTTTTAKRHKIYVVVGQKKHRHICTLLCSVLAPPLAPTSIMCF